MIEMGGLKMKIHSSLLVGNTSIPCRNSKESYY